MGQTSPSPENEVPVELSPFIVNTSEDRGYVATSSLAGTRLKTDLQDIGAAVQVVTKDLMEDLAATNYNDLLLFTTSTETAGLGGNFSGADFPTGDRVNSDDVINNPGGVNRVRGLSAPDRTRDYFLTSIPFDSYNSDRVDISRGANSILFGLGSPSGVVNQSMLRAGLQRNATELRLQSELGASNNLSSRVSLDHNAVIKKDALALRFAALHHKQNFQQEPAFRDQRRMFATVTVRPWVHTTLRASIESGSVISNNPDPLAPVENLSNYLYQLQRYQAAAAAARLPNTNLPLYADPFNTAIRNTAAYQAPNVMVPGFANPLSTAGTNLFKNLAIVYDNSSSSTPSFGFQTSVQPLDITSVANYIGNYPVPPGYLRPGAIVVAQSVGVRNLGQEIPNWSIQGVTDLSVYDFAHHLLAGTAGQQTQKFNSGTIVVEHTLRSGRAGIELAYDQQRFTNSNANPFRGRNGTIRIDVTRTYPTGGQNPNFGRPYVVDRININNAVNDRNAFRATAFGQVDFARDFLGGTRLGRLLGRHILSALYSTQTNETRTTMVQEAWNGGGDPAIEALLDANIGVAQFQRQVAYLDYIGPPVDLLSNPAGLTMRDFVIDSRAIVNQAIPAPGGVVPIDTWTRLSPVKRTYNLVRAPYVRSGSLRRAKDESIAGVLQSRLLDDTLVTIVGWREDKQKFANNNNPPIDPADPTRSSFTTAPRYFNLDDTPTSVSTGRTLTYSAVAKVPKRWRELPFGSEVSLFFSKSSNLQPDPGRLDQFQRILPAPAGKTLEIGVNVSTLHGKLHLRLSRYDSEVTGVSNNRLGGLFNTALIQSTLREIQYMYDDLRGDDPNDPHYATVVRASNEIAALFGAKLDPTTRTISVDDNHAYARTWRAANPSFVVNPATGEIQSFFFNTPPNLRDTQDSRSSGYEAEITYNPARNWRILFNLARQETETANSLPNLTRLMRDFAPVIKGEPGVPSLVGSLSHTNAFSNRTGTGTNAEFWTNSVEAPYLAITSFDGTTSPEQRKWRANFVTNYEFTSDRLKGFSVGANVRWQDRVAIGYPLIADRLGNMVPDRARPYYGPRETNVGFRAGYRTRLLTNRLGWSISLNLQNAFTNASDLIPVLAQPDGSLAQVRTAAPRALVLTNSFKF